MKKIRGFLLVAILLMATMATVDAANTGAIQVTVLNWFNKPNTSAWVFLDNDLPTSIHYPDNNGIVFFNGVSAGSHKVIVKSGIFTKTQLCTVIPGRTSYWAVKI